MPERCLSPTPGEQHDDHVWLTLEGEAWAIQRIEREYGQDAVFRLWRGYAPNLEFRVIIWARANWALYAQAAADA